MLASRPRSRLGGNQDSATIAYDVKYLPTVWGIVSVALMTQIQVVDWDESTGDVSGLPEFKADTRFGISFAT